MNHRSLSEAEGPLQWKTKSFMGAAEGWFLSVVEGWFLSAAEGRINTLTT